MSEGTLSDISDRLDKFALATDFTLEVGSVFPFIFHQYSGSEKGHFKP